jgi:hypothetical protein
MHESGVELGYIRLACGCFFPSSLSHSLSLRSQNWDKLSLYFLAFAPNRHGFSSMCVFLESDSFTRSKYHESLLDERRANSESRS